MDKNRIQWETDSLVCTDCHRHHQPRAGSVKKGRNRKQTVDQGKGKPCEELMQFWSISE